MEEPAQVRDESVKDLGKKNQPQKKTLPLRKVEMKYVKKNQDAREEEKAEEAK